MSQSSQGFRLTGLTSGADTVSLSPLCTCRSGIYDPVIPTMAECGDGSFGSGFGTASRTGRCGITVRGTGRRYSLLCTACIMSKRSQGFRLTGLTSGADSVSLSSLGTGRVSIINPVSPAMPKRAGIGFGSGFGTASRTGRCGITACSTGRRYGLS